MWLMDKLIGSDLNLKRPDFEAAPTQTLDFSGNKLIFKDPPHTSLFPIHDRPADMDIYDKTNLEQQKAGDYAKRFYVKGWELYGKMGAERGGVKASSIIEYFCNLSESLFERNIFEDQILQYCHDMWGEENNSKELGSIGDGLYLYPVNKNELDYVEINGVKWCYFKSQIKGKAPRLQYTTPISSSHSISNSFTISTYKSLDFYSPKTNIEQASFKVIEDFMNNFKIELSEKSKQQLSEAKNPI